MAHPAFRAFHSLAELQPETPPAVGKQGERRGREAVRHFRIHARRVKMRVGGGWWSVGLEVLQVVGEAELGFFFVGEDAFDFAVEQLEALLDVGGELVFVRHL